MNSSLAKILKSLIFAGLLCTGSAQANQYLIATPNAAGFEAEMKEISANPLVIRAVPVFKKSEQKALQDLGQPLMAASVKLELKDQATCKRVRLWAENKFNFVKVERNVETLKDDPVEPSNVHRDNLNPYQWGLNNTGLSQELKQDDIRSIQIPGVVGEDIGLGRTGNEHVSPAPVRVAILDSGIDVNHPAFKGQIITKKAECDALEAYKKCLAAALEDETKKTACDTQYATTDADGNGYPLDCHGWSVAGAVPGDANAPLGSGDPQDTIGHGTHVAGVIGAAANGRGYRGILEHVNLIPVRVIDKNPNNPIRPQDDSLPSPAESSIQAGLGFGDILARGMLYAIRNQAQVINMSLAWPQSADSLLMRKMVALAISKGIVVVASAGNDSNDAQVFPCAYPGVICVGASGPDGALTHFSNFGSFVDVSAPGFRILSTFPMDLNADVYTELPGYEIKNGTSMAAPFVTGVIARLINDGYSPQEAVARLYLSAREVKPNPLRSSQLISKDVRFGNVDLARAYQVTPQALILPTDKQIIRIGWDGKSLSLPISLKLTNQFKDASGPLDLTLSVVDTGPGSREASLSQTQFTIPNWKSGVEQVLSTSLKLTSDRVDGRLSIACKVSSQGKLLNQFRVPVEIAVKIDSLLAQTNGNSLGARSFPITGQPIAPGTSLRTVTQQDPTAPNQYLGVIRGQQNWTLQLITEQANGYLAGAAVQSAAIAGDIFEVDHLPAIAGGTGEQFVLIARIAPAQGQKQQRFLIRFLDGALQTKQEIIYENNPTVITERFLWMKMAGTWVPGWIALGVTPTNEAPDPTSPTTIWKLNPNIDSVYRFYYLSLDGVVHTVASPAKDTQYVSTVVQTSEQRRAGIVPVLLGKGKYYNQVFGKAEVIEGKLVVGETLKFTAEYMQLMTANGIQNVLNQARNATGIGTAYSKPSNIGKMITAIVPVSGNEVTFSSNVGPLNEQTDSAMAITGVYQGARTAGVFAQTHYDLEFHDLGTSEVASTSLNRFSFLPTFIQQKSFFPLVAQDSRNPTGERIPALLIPTGLGDSLSTEIVLPVYEGSHLVGLSRPAKLKLLDSPGCISLGRPRPADATDEGAILFFCGDKMVRVPVRY